MAILKGPNELYGSIGDLVYYTLNGKQVVRRKSGFSTDAFKNNPNYKNVKNNSSEFGHCSKSGKLIRTTIEPFIKSLEDKYLYQRFTKLMTDIKDLDIAEKGQRRIESGLKNPRALLLLKDFKFGDVDPISNHVVAGGSFFSKSFSLKSTVDADRLQLLTLSPDLNRLELQYETQEVDILKRKQILEFELYFQENHPLLFFAILYKGQKILAAGFTE